MTWARCGHPRTPENSKRVGVSKRTGEPKMGCRCCQTASARASWLRYYAKGAMPRTAQEA